MKIEKILHLGGTPTYKLTLPRGLKYSCYLNQQEFEDLARCIDYTKSVGASNATVVYSTPIDSES